MLTIYLTTAACGLGALLLHQVNLAGAVIVMLDHRLPAGRDRDFGNDRLEEVAIRVTAHPR